MDMAVAALLQLFDREIAIGIDTNVGGDVQCLFDDGAGLELGVL
jgi:hypothetical protein